MAKSIRSKVKKRNRTEMRKTMGDQHQKKLQARCTAKLHRAVAFSQGEGAAKLNTMLTAAQLQNPPTKEASKNGFSFRHPDAPPRVLEDEDIAPPSSISRLGRPPSDVKAREAGTSSVQEGTTTTTTMGYVDVVMDDGGIDIDIDGSGGRLAAGLTANKLKKKRKKARRRGGVEYPSPSPGNLPPS